MNVFFDRVTLISSAGKIPWKVAEEGYRNLKSLCSSIAIIEKNTDLPFPDVVVEPELKVLLHESQIQSVVHANIDFRRWDYRVSPIVSVSLPLLVFGRKALYTVVLLHEFLHYLYLSMKFLESDFFSLHLKVGDTATGRLIFDEVGQISPKNVVKSKYLINLVTEKFRHVINDRKFISTIENKWIGRNLPVINLRSQDFAVRLSPSDFTSLYFPDAVLKRARQLLENASGMPRASNE
ncbi:MAG: hypothetical protein ACE5GD_09365 [Candidatus Geothermarchaeales archaeon]